MQKLELVVPNEVGLHARPAAVFVQTANKYVSSIKVRNLTNGRDFVDGKSILGLLLLGVGKNHTIEIDIEGSDEVQAAQTLKEMIESDFSGLL
jgi:phosphotransferase system HPr (HPr) family protein